MNSATVINNGLKVSHQQKLISIIKKQSRVESIWLFGSRALGTFKDHSDIDIVLVGKCLTLSDLEKILTKIELTSIPYEVDILIKHKISSKELLAHIDNYAVRWL